MHRLILKTKLILMMYPSNMFWKKEEKENKLDVMYFQELLLQNEYRTKVDLILKHLNLEYVPESKEPAKLKSKYVNDIATGLVSSVSTLGGVCGASWMTDTRSEPKPPKKKRGRPKKK